MDTVCRGLDFVFVYLDDILIASRNEVEHRSHLTQLFTRLQEHGLVIIPEKCKFGFSQTDFLGHVIDAQSATPLPDKVKVIRQFQ